MRTLAFIALAALVAVPALASAKSYDFEAYDVYFTLAGETAHNPALTVEAGENVTINLVQKGVQPHNWVIDGVAGAKAPATGFVTAAGQTANATFTAPASGTYRYYCQAHPTDMKGSFTIASAGGDMGDDDMGDDGGDSGADMDDEKKSPGVEVIGVLAVVGAALILARRK